MDLIDRGSGRMGLSAAVPPRGGRVKVLLHEVRWASAPPAKVPSRAPPIPRGAGGSRRCAAGRRHGWSLSTLARRRLSQETLLGRRSSARAVPPIWLMGLRSSPHKQQRYRFTPSHQDSLGIGAFHEKNHTSKKLFSK